MFGSPQKTPKDRQRNIPPAHHQHPTPNANERPTNESAHPIPSTDDRLDGPQLTPVLTAPSYPPLSQFSPSLLAAAIVYSARHALSVAPLWRPELEELTGHCTEDAHQVFLKIWGLYSDTFPAHARRTSASPKSVTDFEGELEQPVQPVTSA